jgi:HK97 family phage major capsid protein
MATRLFELQERRAAIVTEMRAINTKAETEKRDYSADEDKRHKELKTELAGLDTKIERARDLQEAERAAPAILHHGRGDGHFEERARDFSIIRAIRAAIGDQVDAGFEREISAETERRTGRQARGIMIPDQAFLEKRVMLADPTGSPAGAGAPLYPTTIRPDLFIDRLRASLVVARLGATVIDNLFGDISIPRQTGSVATQWLAEDEDIDASDLAFDDVQLKPRTIGGLTSYSRKLLLNSTPSIEAIVRNDLARTVANAIDAAALLGPGTGNAPTGIVAQSGVTELSLATPSWTEVLAFISTVQGNDGDVGGLAWALAPGATATLRGTAKVSSTDSVMIQEAPDSLAGYPAIATTALMSGDSPDKSTVILGSWSQLLVGRWGGVDILANPFAETAYVRGRVLVRVMADVDIAVRHPESFAFASDMPV